MKTKGVISVILAYPAAAAVGAAIVAAGFAATGVVVQALNGMSDQILAGLWITPAAFIYAFVVFLAGLVVIGTPVWLVLARLGRTAQRDAALAGAALCFLTGAIFVLAAGEPIVAWEPWALAVSLAIPGAGAGWTLHRVAYGKTAS